MDSSLSPSDNEAIRILPANQQEKTTESIQKQYENMTYDEMAQHLAATYKELSCLIKGQPVTPTCSTSTSSSFSSSTTTTTTTHHLKSDWSPMNEATPLNEQDIISSLNVDDTMKKSQLTRLFWRSASAGDTDKVRTLLLDKKYNQWIDMDAKDEDGTTPLIYAVCFGKEDIAQVLLSSGAKTDIQDSFGWTALMWATNNNHDHIVKMLLEYGASSQTKSCKGRTVFDFVNADNQKIVDILATNPRDSLSSTSSLLRRQPSSQFSSISSTSSTTTTDDCDFNYQSIVEGYDDFMTEAVDRQKKQLESALIFDSINDDDEEDEDGDDDFDAIKDDTTDDFKWDRCLPDQMFVFGADDLPYILDTMITNIQLPLSSQHEISIPANVIFFSARFAHYFSTEELLNQVLDGSIQRITQTIKINIGNVHTLAFWIKNLTQLLFYLKKDNGLVVATANHQLNLSELISETYTSLVNDTEYRIAKILGPAMLEYNEIPGMDDVNFSDDWQRFFRRGSRRSMMGPPSRPMKRNTKIISLTDSGTISPQLITNLLSSTLFVLRSYHVHPTIITQSLTQFFHYLSCELFNQILANKKLLCRSKAMQIRMNLSQIEDWICANHLPAHLASYLTPTTQLLQLLQCLTQLTDLVSFINTVNSFDLLNALQVKRCVTNYRYEVNEPRLPEEIDKYAIQLAEDTVRLSSISLKRQSMSRSSSIRRTDSQGKVGSSSTDYTTTKSNDDTPIDDDDDDVNEDDVDVDDNDDELEKEIKETKDSKFMLPFSVPSNCHPNTKDLVPVIPEHWMEILDNRYTD